MTLYELLEVIGKADSVADTIYDWTVDTDYEWADIDNTDNDGQLARLFNYTIYNLVKLEKRRDGVIIGNFTEVIRDNWENLKAPIEKHFNIDLTDTEQAQEDFLYYVLKNMLWGEYSENLYKDFLRALLDTKEETKSIKTRIYTGTIFDEDVKEYGLPENCQMVATGCWVNGSKKITSYQFADGSHAEMQFSKDRNNVFYLEAIN